MDLLCFSVLYLLSLLCLFICALSSPAGKGLTSWLSFVASNSIPEASSIMRELAERSLIGTYLYS